MPVCMPHWRLRVPGLRRARPAGLGAGWRGLAAAAAVAGVLAPGLVSTARGQCVLVRERTPQYAPHLAMHFGDVAEIPRNLQCASALDKRLPTLCVPIYAYNLWEGATSFELAIRTPMPPVGFDRGPEIMDVTMTVNIDAEGARTSLRMRGAGPLCGPVLLGCLRISTANAPDQFRVTVAPHATSGLAAVQTPSGEWRALQIDDGGARVGLGADCPPATCPTNSAVRDLVAAPGEISGSLSLGWTGGSGNFTLLRYRMDGEYPADPWDGELLAFLPSTVNSLRHLFNESGELRVAAWSVTRGPFATLYAASNLECGSLASAIVHIPVGVSTKSWGNVKTLYR